MSAKRYDVVVVGSGAGGGTVAQALAPLVADGRKVLVVERGPRFDDAEFTGEEAKMAPSLYADAGGFLTAEGTLTLAFGRAYGGSTVVYTGTSLAAPERVIRSWNVPGLEHADLKARSARYAGENSVHLLPEAQINDNNRLFAEGCAKAGFHAEQFPVNVKGCRGSSLCNLGCPNGAKQGTHKVQLPMAERAGVEVVTRSEVVRLEERRLHVRVSEKPAGSMGAPSEWPAGEYAIDAGVVVLAGGVMGSSPLLLRSPWAAGLPRLGEGFTCHPAHILVAEHPQEITNDVGHPKSYFMDRAVEDGFVLETCMYFPFVTAKNLSGFGSPHASWMAAFPRLQMILVLACDKAVAGNRVAVDSAGRTVVHYRYTPQVVTSLVKATRAAARIFFAAGAKRVHAPSAEGYEVTAAEQSRLDERISERHFTPGRVSVAAAHLMGGCGMGADAATSVTDGWGRVHGVPWLRVADASLFPDSLEINPYLTIMALADRVAEKVRAEIGSLAPGAVA